MVEIFKIKAMELFKRENQDSNSKNGTKEALNTEEILLRMVKEIAKFYTKDDEAENLTQHKLTLMPRLWLEMSQKDIFKKNSSLAHYLSKELKENKIVNRSSVLYPKNIKFISSNPLTRCFVHGKIGAYDKVMDYRDALLERMTRAGVVSESFALDFFIYLRFFHLDQIPLKHFKYLEKAHYCSLSKRGLFIFTADKIEEYHPIYIYILDTKITPILDKIYTHKESSTENKGMDKIFLDSISSYDGDAKNEIQRMMPDLTLADIRRLVQLEYQLHYTPLSLTLMLSNTHPRISVLEIEKMYPKSMPVGLLAIEKRNIEIYRSSDDRHSDDEEEVLLEKYLFEDLEIYDQLKGILKTPFESKAFKKYLKEWQSFIESKSTEQTGFLLSILRFSKLLLDKSDAKKDVKPIKPKTLKEYLRVSFQYAFKYIMAEGDINEEAIKNIEISIIYNDTLNIPTQRKYKRIINLFLQKMTEYKSLGQIESTANIRRSVVYKDELDELVDKLAIEDKRNIKNLTDNNFLLVYKNVVFSLLLYYSGCRKNELRSRLVEDMMLIPSNEFSIDISKVGVRKLRKAEVDKGQDLKTAAAKRRVRFQILDDSHHAIVKRYLGIVEKKNYDFLFPAHNKVTFKIYKKKVISESSLDIIGKSLQEITKRYTPLHSLRHSYATNQLKYLYESKQSRVEDLFEISNKMGHRDPYVSISSYMHIDLLKLENILRY